MTAPDPSFHQDIFVGRQPIYGRRLELFAYELLFRGGDVDFADFEEGDRATSQVILNAVTEFGLERVVGGHLAFVNLTRGFIVGEYPLPVPRTRVVLEVLEDIEPEPEVIEGLRALRRRGFKIALDDFAYAEKFDPMLDLADIVKLDILGLDGEEIRARFERMKPFGPKLLAEKIETRQQFDQCLEIGFDYFQGYFLAKPNVLSGTSVPASRLNLLRLLSELQEPGCDFGRVQDIVSQDVTLSYKLLRHINSAIYGMPRRVDSIKDTVVYLGMTTVRNLACLFVLSDADNMPHDLMITAMLRAKMCELLARAHGIRDPQPFFTVGLFSVLDAMMNATTNTVLERLPLTEDLRDALLERRGPLGEALRCVLAYERGQWDDVECFALTRSEIKTAFFDAVDWVEGADREISGLAA